jgi:hypothetical protein
MPCGGIVKQGDPPMTEIDYEALAEAAYEAASPSACSCGDFDFDLSARAVVAAYKQQLRDQGLVVVRSDVIDAVSAWKACHDEATSDGPDDGWSEWANRVGLDYQNAADALSAALAAPGDGETI